MATTPATFSRFGYTLALAERTLSAVLHDHLAERGTDPGTWYALQLIAMYGDGRDREALTADLAGSRTLDAGSASEVLSRLEAEGLIRGGTRPRRHRRLALVSELLHLGQAPNQQSFLVLAPEERDRASRPAYVNDLQRITHRGHMSTNRRLGASLFLEVAR